MQTQPVALDANDHVAAPTAGGLRRECLSYPEVLAQSVSVIAPSTVPAAIIGLIFASAGTGTWLSFLLGMLGLVLVSLNVNQFATRSASPGSLYTYIVRGLGPTSGILGGWALVFAYTLTGMSTLCGFALVANVLLGQATGLQLPVLLWFAIGAGLSGWVAMRNIQLSAKTMLVFEAVAIVSIVILGVLIWRQHGFEIDSSQFRLEGASPSGVLVGVVLTIFAFSGFESSTSLGAEAKDPLKTIPRSVMHSVVFSGIVFIFMAYVVVLGFKGETASLATSEAPLDHLASRLGVGPLGTVITIGVMLSFFACTLAAINSTARIIYSMSRHGLFFEALGEAHETNRTPHVAVAVAALITFAAPAAVHLAGVGAFDAQGYFGTLCSFGFITVYILITIAAPLYLRSIGRLTARAVAYSVAGLAFMALPLLGTFGLPGSELFPPIGFPDSLLSGLFLVYMLIGVAWLLVERIRRPRMIATMQGAVEAGPLPFAVAPAAERAA
ncbi:amino acid permease [Methylopila jiangsuensis]|uniref:Amino acid permease n=1 Tax=Methylopila jiangsuensis TaxID=586230 RepID=A0A9W6N374_9HYPH|nr:APC family permease [Methylopila jiangsuensis]MDR6286931.1 amino acid transporter [Methylopila jiangsuensis]GLK76719.1 amino acid permease [Methylopila jiangsuensis]